MRIMLVTNKDLLLPARQRLYAIGVFNINNLETPSAAFEVASEKRSAAIIPDRPVQQGRDRE
jgi:fructose/tagatose bisphosphate aldolase